MQCNDNHLYSFNIDNFFTNFHFVKIFLIFNVNICDIVRNNAINISRKLKKKIVTTKSQLNLKQWIHRIVNELINCFVWKNLERNHVISFVIIAYILQTNEQTSRKIQFTIDMFFRDDFNKIVVKQFIIAMQYNFHINHVNRAN